MVLLADSSKFGSRALCKVLEARSIHTVITDGGCPREAVDTMRSLGQEVILAQSTLSAEG
jgi:DeoR/GlpR family transcriptional regulator of sugar metabolism